MRTIANTVTLADYAEIQEGVEVVQKASIRLVEAGAKIVIPHEHRWWEYGTGVQLLLNRYGSSLQELQVLDVGPGWGVWGPALVLEHGVNVTEYQPRDPEHDYVGDRVRTNQILHGLCERQITMAEYPLESMPEVEWDVVACISVLEHVEKRTERQAWRELAKRVRVGGLLYITCDIVEVPGRQYTFDHLRALPNYTLGDVQSRVEELVQECGMRTLGVPDWEWHGNLVFDYTFYRVAMERIH